MKQEDIKELWELCGYTGKLESIQPVEGQKEGKLVYVSPEFTLDNLFKNAVLKLGWFKVLFEHIEVSCDYYVTITDFYLAQPCKEYTAEHQDPAEALAQVILRVLRGKE